MFTPSMYRCCPSQQVLEGIMKRRHRIIFLNIRLWLVWQRSSRMVDGDAILSHIRDFQAKREGGRVILDACDSEQIACFIVFVSRSHACGIAVGREERFCQCNRRPHPVASAYMSPLTVVQLGMQSRFAINRRCRAQRGAVDPAEQEQGRQE